MVTATDKSFVVSFVINLVTALVFLFLFVILRRLVPKVYQPRCNGGYLSTPFSFYLLFVICYFLFFIFYFLFSIFLFICIELTYCTVSILHHLLLHPSLVGLKPLYGIISSPSFTFLHPTPFFYSFFTFYLFMFYFCVGMMTKRCTGRTGLTQ